MCKIEPPDLLFLVFISFYISRYHFSQIFRMSFRIIRKKDFFQFFFFNGFTQTPPHPLNGQNLLSMMKVFSTLPYKAPAYLSVEIVENAMINVDLVRLSLQEWPKVGHGTARV